MKNILAVLALFLVVFSSGCTLPGLNIEIPFIPDIFGGPVVNTQTADIITIERLDVLPSTTVRSGQSVSLRAVVKNLQKPEYQPINIVKVTLYNDCGMFDVKGDFCANGFKDDKTCDITKMYPQSTAMVQWKLTAKDINVETPCKIGIMATYDYITYSTTSVTFVNKAELERIVAEGKSSSETGTLSIGEGPVKPYIEVLNQPIVIDSSATGPITNQGSGIMSFWIENKGSGIIELLDSSKGNVKFYTGERPSRESTTLGEIYIKVSSTLSGNEESIAAIKDSTKESIQDCLKRHLESNIAPTSGQSTKVYNANFIGKSTPKYSCSITVNDPSSIKQKSTYQITAEIWYDYKFTKETTITVQPKIKF